MRPREIELQIDELVLHGFAAGDRRRVGQAVERELARLLGQAAAGGAIPRALTVDGAVASGDGGAVHLVAGAGPEAAGAQVAQAVYRALTGAAGAAAAPAGPSPYPGGAGVPAAPRGATR